MWSLHRAAVHLRQITGERRSLEEILECCEAIDAVLNEMLRGRSEADALCAMLDVPVDAFDGSYAARSTWLWGAYDLRVSLAMIHATRAFLKAIVLQPEPHLHRRLSHWFDAYEVAPVDMLRYGPVWAAKYLDTMAFTVPPIIQAAEVFKAVLRDDRAYTA